MITAKEAREKVHNAELAIVEEAVEKAIGERKMSCIIDILIKPETTAILESDPLFYKVTENSRGCKTMIEW